MCEGKCPHGSVVVDNYGYFSDCPSKTEEQPEMIKQFKIISEKLSDLISEVYNLREKLQGTSPTNSDMDAISKVRNMVINNNFDDTMPVSETLYKLQWPSTKQDF